MESYGKYDRPVKIADGVFWVGFRDKNSSIFCNPYLIVEDGQAVLIDSGSRGDFAIVMMRILQAGIDPSQIIALIYQHYDPDLCGSMPNFIDMCDNPDLKLFSEESNKLFLSHYIHKDTYHLLHSINLAEKIGMEIRIDEHWSIAIEITLNNPIPVSYCEQQHCSAAISWPLPVWILDLKAGLVAVF